MQIVTIIFIFYILNFSLIRSNDTSKDNSTAIDERSNVPVIKSSSSKIFFEEQFQDKKEWRRWIKSQANKDGVDENISKYDGEWAFEIPESSVYKNNYGLILKSKAKHHAISVHLNKPFDFSSDSLIVQYEIKFQTNQECGGAYIKLLSNDDLDLNHINDKTPYTIMFGPDMCGVEYKYHFIIRFRNPKTGVYSEHHAKKSSESLTTYFTDKKSHLYTLLLSDDNNFKMYIDNKLINSGNLLQDMEPSIIPSTEILDENDRKPDDWNETEKVIDTNARKPDDWDETAPREIIDNNANIPNDWLEYEPLIVSDPDATKPEDWNDEMDGIWEAPTVDNPLCKNASGCGKWIPPKVVNPAYKGPWSAPLIDNPNYRGKWESRKIPNPDYFAEAHPYKLTPIGSLALELWSLVDGVVFDNFLLTSDLSIAKQYADQLWDPKSILEGKTISPPTTTTSLSKRIVDTIINTTKTRPWLWAVYLAVILLPIMIIMVYCWSRDSKIKETYDGIKKKNDDDDDDDYEEEEVKNDYYNVKSKISRKDRHKKTSIGRKARRRMRTE